MKWWGYLIIGVIAFAYLLTYALCVMAGKTDERNGCK